MTLLKSLQFCPVPTDEKNPVLSRRMKLLARLEEQQRLAANPDYAVTIRRNRKGPGGERNVVERSRRVRPWWKRTASGQIVLSVRNGLKPIEFEKGKAGIVIETEEKLRIVLDTLIKAASSGELDQYLENGVTANTRPKKKAP